VRAEGDPDPLGISTQSDEQRAPYCLGTDDSYVAPVAYAHRGEEKSPVA
jgi:hypothetical protein